MRNQLGELAQAIRQSTLTRLRLVPAGLENWRIDEEAMSFADTAQHLLDSDEWLLDALRTSNALITLNLNGRFVQPMGAGRHRSGGQSYVERWTMKSIIEVKRSHISELSVRMPANTAMERTVRNRP